MIEKRFYLNTMKIVSTAMLLACPLASHAVLPDKLTINVGDIDNDGEEETLVLTKRSMRSATGHKLLTWDSINKYQEITAPEVRTYRGYVQDDISMRVNANIEPGNASMNANFSDGHNLNIRLTQFPVSVSSQQGNADPGNGNHIAPFIADRTAPTESGYIVPLHNMRRLDYAVSINNSYFTAMGSIEAAVARVEQRMNDTDFFYARDMGLAHEINWMIIDLDEHDVKWKKEWYNVHRPNGAVFEVATMFKKSGGAGAGGDVFKNAFHTTGTTAAYSKSQGHELGHNLGAGHYSSWSDVMSGSESALGSGTVERMIGNAHIATEVQSPELIYTSPLPPFAMEDVTTMVMNTHKDIDVLENDYDGNGDDISLSYVDATTAKGGTARIINGKVRYTPPPHWQGQDTFIYHVMDETGIANRTGYVKVAVHNNGLATHIKFDETSGTAVYDSGPFQAHGQLTDGLKFSGSENGQSVAGIAANALAREVDEEASGYNNRASADFWGTGDPLDGDMSVSLWVKFQAGLPETAGPIIAKGGAVIRGRFGKPRGGWDIGHTKDGRFRFEGNLNRDSEYTYANAQFDLEADESFEEDTWYHLVMVMDRETQTLQAWVNGKKLSKTTSGTTIADGAIDNSHHPLVIFDSVSQQQQGEDTPVTVDEVRIYHKALSQYEVLALLNDPQKVNKAGAPNPINSANDVQPSTSLNWISDDINHQYDVYFGHNASVVKNAGLKSPFYQGRQSENRFDTLAVDKKSKPFDAATADGKRYFWRVDTITSSGIIPGDVWWFDVNYQPVPVLNTPPVVNESFENIALESGAFSKDIANWYDAGNYTFTQDDEIETHPSTPYGDNWGELARGRWIYQQIGYYNENINLDISFLLGRRTDKDSLATRVSLLVGGDPALAIDTNSKYSSNPLVSTVGAQLITSSEQIDALAVEGSTVEQSVTLSTGTGFKIGDPLWLQIDIADTGSGRVLIDNVRVNEASK